MASMSNKWEQQIVWPAPGHYVVAVSGGVDSVTLLDLLMEHGGYELEIAYFNHGWTSHGDEAQEIVKWLAKKYGLPFHTEKASAKITSEAAARQARYAFLRRVKGRLGAAAIITAHHEDDVFETVVLNLRRGTGRRGLTPFGTQPDVLRPLVDVSKEGLRAYATAHQLEWLEDPTNTDTSYTRNAVRHELASKKGLMTSWDHEIMREVLVEAACLNRRIDTQLAALITKTKNQVHAQLPEMRRMPIATLQELIVMMAQTARPGTELGRRTIETLAVDIKTGRLHSRRELTRGLFAQCLHGTVAVVFTSGKAGLQA